MSWDITILAIQGTEKPVQDVVADVFFDSEETVSFEDASSASLGSNLAAGTYEGWTFVMDAWHRISNHDSYLQELSEKSELFIFRISEQPYFARWRSGKRVAESQNADAMRSDLAKLAMAPNRPDPESVAQAFFQAMTGISFPFGEAKFTLFTLD